MLVAIYHLQDVERARARRLIIREPSIVVGSDPSCTIVIDDDPSVEPRHARFVVRAVDFVVDSLGGAIVVNGTPITGATACRPGDSIQLGETVVKLRPESPVVVTEQVTQPRHRPPTEPWEGGAYVPPRPDAPFRPPVGPTGVLAPSNPPRPQPVPPSRVMHPIGTPPRPAYLLPQPIKPPKLRRAVLSSDPIEQGFLETLRDRPDDIATRLVYADWLEERGWVAKAQLVRGEADRDHENLLAECDPSWRAITSTATVELCEVAGCPQRWDAFAPSPDDERVRGCASCERDVRYCVAVLDLTGATARNERAVRDAAIAGDPDPGDTLDDSSPVLSR
ncbi:MAG: hypothetical protein JWO36_641 [Myxococcales bacterium]|nr:hypothetical protein [Myxococcales bacterium]